MNPNTLQKDILTAFKGVLGDYFDGASHSFGGQSYAFPTCDIGFGRPQLGKAMTNYRIQIHLMPERDSMRKVRKEGGSRLMVKRPVMFHVFTNDPQGLWDKCDNVQSLLGVVLTGAAATLAASGMKLINMGEPVQVQWDETHDVQVSRRTCLYRYEVEYGREG